MKTLVTVCRWLVGLLFIFSGLIKANDPHGLSYKMQEFFEAWHTEWLNNFSLTSSIAMNIVEVVAGVAIIIGYRSKFFSWLLLLLISFFTFLTSYVLFSKKIAACGCFGDCVPLTPVQTFTKDVILLILILLIFFYRNKIQTLLPAKAASISIIATFLLVGFMQFYALKHLPYKDCLPYKIGNDILEQMQPPTGSVADSFVIYYNYKKDGKMLRINADSFPENFDSTYEQIGEPQKKLVRQGNNTPKIPDFTLKKIDSTESLTQQVLQQPTKYVMIYVKEFPADATQLNNFLNINVIKKFQQQNVPVYVVTGDVVYARKINLPNINILQLDATVLKTAARANPTFFLMQGAKVLNKKAGIDADKL